MKINIHITKSFLSLAFALGVVLSIWSCDKQEHIYTPDNRCMTFATASGTFDLTGEDIAVKVQRGARLNEDAILKLTLESDAPYTLKTPAVTFKAGEGTATAVISYDLSQLKPATAYKFTLKFAEDSQNEISPAGTGTFNGTGMMPLEYEDYAKVGYFKTLLTQVYGTDAFAENDIVLQRAKYTTTYFRLKNVYKSKTDIDLVLNPEDGTFVITNLKNESWAAQNDCYAFPTGLEYSGNSVTACLYKAYCSLAKVSGGSLADATIPEPGTLFHIPSGFVYGNNIFSNTLSTELLKIVEMLQ